VHQYLPAIIQYVEDDQPANVVCGPHELHMCASEKKTVVKRAIKKPAVNFNFVSLLINDSLPFAIVHILLLKRALK
jgi:hypothetical protein